MRSLRRYLIEDKTRHTFGEVTHIRKICNKSLCEITPDLTLGKCIIRTNKLAGKIVYYCGRFEQHLAAAGNIALSGWYIRFCTMELTDCGIKHLIELAMQGAKDKRSLEFELHRNF